MTIQTLTDAFDNRDAILQILNDRRDEIKSPGIVPFDSCKMDSVLVLPDAVARIFLEIGYVFDTNFVPEGLPACGMLIGDFIEHENKRYLAISLGVMLHNMMAFHMIRKHEKLYREWYDQKDALSVKVANFLGEIRAIDENCFGIEVFQKPNAWQESYVGWTSLEIPSTKFIDGLTQIAEKHGTLVIPANMLKNELAPYAELKATMDDIRVKADHKGFPYIADNMFRLNTPAVSGGASFHTVSAGDNLTTAIPAEEVIFLMAAQTGNIPVEHIGAGTTTGKHITFQLPKTPFFDEVKGQIDKEATLKSLWLELQNKDASVEVADQWIEATKTIKDGVIKKVVPDLIGNLVLGFQLDLKSQRRIANLRPVVAGAYLKPKTTLPLLNQYGCQVFHENLEDLVLLKVSQGYGSYRSVFEKTQ